MPGIVTRKCPECNGDMPKRNKFCSKVCSASFYGKRKGKSQRNQCKNCGKECRRSKQIYCCGKCHYDSRKGMEQVETERVCEMCSKTFLQWDKVKPIQPKGPVCEDCRSLKRKKIARKCRLAAKDKIQNLPDEEKRAYYERSRDYSLGRRKNLKIYFGNISRGARSRGLSVEIMESDLIVQLIRQNGVCALSGRRISLLNSSASLDRVNSDLGYTKDNIQWIYKPLNTMKMDIPQAEFIQLCKEIAAYHS